MENQQSPNITSFIIRFVFVESNPSSAPLAESNPSYRGTIRHIQSDQEIPFTRWEDAVDFIQRHIPAKLEG